MKNEMESLAKEQEDQEKVDRTDGKQLLTGTPGKTKYKREDLLKGDVWKSGKKLGTAPEIDDYWTKDMEPTVPGGNLRKTDKPTGKKFLKGTPGKDSFHLDDLDKADSWKPGKKPANEAGITAYWKGDMEDAGGQPGTKRKTDKKGGPEALKGTPGDDAYTREELNTPKVWKEGKKPADGAATEKYWSDSMKDAKPGTGEERRTDKADGRKLLKGTPGETPYLRKDLDRGTVWLPAKQPTGDGEPQKYWDQDMEKLVGTGKERKTDKKEGKRALKGSPDEDTYTRDDLDRADVWKPGKKPADKAGTDGYWNVGTETGR